MKILMTTILLLTMLGVNLKAQTFSEWFKQKKTQKEYLFQQIAALQLYMEYAEKGYKMVDGGLNTIHGISNAEFFLHDDYLSSLKNVNSKIKGDVKVAEIIALQLIILKTSHNTLRRSVDKRFFSEEEMNYIKRVFQRLLEGCGNNIEDLTNVIVNSDLTLSDGERKNRINDLWIDMRDKYLFCKGFDRDMKILGNARAKETNDVKTGISLHGFQNEKL